MSTFVPWYVVVDTSQQDELGNGPQGIAITPHEDDVADAIAWMQEGTYEDAVVMAKSRETAKALTEAVELLREARKLLIIAACDRGWSEDEIAFFETIRKFLRGREEMSDRISEIEEQAKVILEWCRQQRLPEEERDTLELRERCVNGKAEWVKTSCHPTNLNLYDFRLCKCPKKHTATVYWYRYRDGTIEPSLAKFEWPGAKLLGATTDEFTEPQE